ncbi:hypothetical protein AB0C19_17735 [Micromonospora sp. NPDC048842]|uniref:hypothetical protein n=1 Tax=Micromonospora sp. NPDC048842 TaxID=3154346 RepID=UPI003410E291
MTTISTPAATQGDFFEAAEHVDHRLVGARLRPLASAAVLAKSVAAAVTAGLSEELAETLANSAADQQQLRAALRMPKIQRFGVEQFTYIEFDVLTWRILPSPDNIRFEGEHARGMVGMPRFGARDGQPLLTFEMRSAQKLIDAMGPRITDMAENNPHVASIMDRGIETPGWLSFLELTTDVGTVIRLESTDGFGRTVAAHKGLGIAFKDAAWNLRPGSRRAATLHNNLVEWADSDVVTDEQARMVRCAIMPHARVIIGYSAPRGFDRARRRLVAHLHMAPPMNFSIATTLNAKANAAIDKLHERGLLPVPDDMTADEVRDILDGSNRAHNLYEDQVAVLACGALNPPHNRRAARVVNEAVADLTGAKPRLEERTQLAAEVALRGFPADKRLTALRSSLERAWRWSALRGVELTWREPLELLLEAIRELVRGDDTGPAITELAVIASYHMVGGRTQLLTRSEFGGRGSSTEPAQILTQMTRTDSGLRQLCQIVLDGRAERAPQELPDGVQPRNKRIPDAETLTAARLRQLAKLSDEQGITHDSPEDLFAAAIQQFQDCLEQLHCAAQEIESIVDDTGVTLVDKLGYDNPTVKDTLTTVADMASEWRGARRRAERMRGDLDSNGGDR